MNNDSLNAFIGGLNADHAAMVAKVQARLVQVVNAGGMGQGAGVIWRADGLIITNNHVVGRRGVRVVLPDGKEVNAELIGRAANHDLAALKVDAHDLPTFTPGNSGTLRAGEVVTAVGHPWGVTGAATSGILVGTTNGGFPGLPMDGGEWVVASLHMRPGHSGGALVDSQGRLIGINMMINGPDVGVAIPVDVVKRFVAKLEQSERESYSQAQAASYRNDDRGNSRHNGYV